MTSARTTVGEGLAAAADRIAEAGSDTPRLDAELLLAEATCTHRAALFLHTAESLGPEPAERFERLVARREAREPVAYLLRRKGFRHLDLNVDPRVLVPRPETETLVEVALDELPEGARVLDVGTGSGAVALALRHERPDLHVTGSDTSADALAVARANAERLAIDVPFVLGDLFDAALGPWDGIVSNPPYVAEAQRDDLPPELSFEPDEALFAGVDGLAMIRRLIPAAAQRTPWLALEVGAGQAEAVSGFARDAGFDHVRTRRDLAGIARVVVASR